MCHCEGDGSGEEAALTNREGRNDHSGQRAGAEVVISGGTRDTAADNNIELGRSVIGDKWLMTGDLDTAQRTKL
jgi:hypothetical protein